MSSFTPAASRRAFVAGATGYTGLEVVRVSTELGLPTVAHVRADSPLLEDWRHRFTLLGATVDATPWGLAPMTDTIRRIRPTHVFALLGTTRARRQQSTAAQNEGYETVDYGLTHELLQAVLASGVRARFVYLSAAGASERASSAYMRVRGRMEQEIRASGLPYLIARPAIISGPDRAELRPLERMAAVVGDRALGVLAAFGARGLRDRYRSISGHELAEALVTLALDDRTERLEVGREELGLQRVRMLPRSPV
ncbi:MAG TPA: NAD(P)H-binding protein [Gemmatimonadaceae bacterium]|jgi:nucleoside-diphosphate-sugar epimerase|nr:NAD(P)H-binding protein [Gemmatimonadaceae bacterium]